MKSDFMIMKKSPVTKRKTQEMTNIMADAIGYRDNDNVVIRKMIGAEVVGMTVCPCAKESTQESAKQELLKFLDTNHSKSYGNGFLRISQSTR